MNDIRSGWYSDPDDPEQLRYWDGIVWSDRRMPRVKPGLDSSSIGTPSAYSNDEHSQGDSSAQTSVREPYAHQPQASQPPGQQGGWQSQTLHPTTPDSQRLSGWWRRFGAWLIDWIIIGLIAAIVSFPWMSEWLEGYQAFVDDATKAMARGESMPEIPQNVVQLPIAWMIATLVVYATYEIGLLVAKGRTLGKMVTGISVRPMNEARKPTFDEAFRRFGVKGIATILNPIPLLSAFGSFITLADGLWPLFDPNKQSIHDKVAKTVVVIGRSTGQAQQGQQPPTHQAPTS